MPWALWISVFVIAACGLIYELLAGTLASYLLGDSITQFSTVIGAYLFSMGIGSYLSRYLAKGLVRRFVEIEILVGLVGGCSTALLFLAFPHVASFRVLLYALVGIIGIGVGLEIPLLMRMLRERMEFKEVVARVLALDYVGALVASILFPLLLVPQLGLVQTGFFFGIANAAVALWTAWLFRAEIGAPRLVMAEAVAAILFLSGASACAKRDTDLAEGALFADPVVFARATPYQRIVLTEAGGDLRLYLNAHLQFSTRDEYRYHEALVHPAMGTARSHRRVLVLGGGDGCAVREVLKYPGVESVTLVDLDPEMTKLFRDHAELAAVNAQALRDPRVRIVNADAFPWLDADEGAYDAAIIDFPDPSNYSIGKLTPRPFSGS